MRLTVHWDSLAWYGITVCLYLLLSVALLCRELDYVARALAETPARRRAEALLELLLLTPVYVGYVALRSLRGWWRR